MNKLQQLWRDNRSVIIFLALMFMSYSIKLAFAMTLMAILGSHYVHLLGLLPASMPVRLV